MARELTEPIDEIARRAIVAAMHRKGLSQAELARSVGVDRAVINKIVKGKQKSATISTIAHISDALGISAHKLLRQYELEFKIDERFSELAQKSLADELARLRSEVGTIRALRVTGTVGVRFHGLIPEERVFERVFALQQSTKRPFRRRKAM